MTPFHRCFAPLCLLLWLALAPAAPLQAQTDSGDAPLAALPYTPGLDTSALDRSADACVDFYQFACGGWMQKNPIPADQSSWSVYGKLQEDNRRFLWGILQELSERSTGRTDSQQKIGDFFGACMDEAAIEQRGAEPLQRTLAMIDAMRSKRELPAVLARLHLATGDEGLFFSFGADQDYANSSRVIAFARAGGLGMPDRDYYVKTDQRSIALRERYREHVRRMFVLLGEPGESAASQADGVMAIETALATASLTQLEQRDPYQLFHKMSARQLQALTPDFHWRAYLKASGLPEQGRFNVTEPAFYRALQQQLQTRSLDEIKSYLRWHVAHATAPLLSKAFVEEDFSFFKQALLGVPQLRPRWKRCVALVDAQLGDALGREFVERAFSPDMKRATRRMTQQIEAAMRDELNRLDWMSPATRRHALDKLHAIVNKIGYPDTWRDYRSIAISREDLVANVERTTIFESRRQLQKIGKPLDRGDWGMTPPTVNAYYSPQMNDINFPAGVLQPPLYDPKMDDASNYGNTGGTIGHELTHAFDDEGRQFDPHGNLRNWWTKQDEANFNTRAQCVVDQFAQYTVIDDIKINSRLTEGEDVADLGGLVLAFAAWKAQTLGQKPELREGFTPEQRFFVGYAQWACENSRPENQRAQALTDSHSPGRYRVNGPLMNLPEFQKAFACRPGQPMVPEKRCKVW